MEHQQCPVPGEGLPPGVVVERGALVVGTDLVGPAGHVGIEAPEIGGVIGVQPPQTDQCSGEQVIQRRLRGLLPVVIDPRLRHAVHRQAARLGHVPHHPKVFDLVQVLEGRHQQAKSQSQKKVGQKNERGPPVGREENAPREEEKSVHHQFLTPTDVGTSPPR